MTAALSKIKASANTLMTPTLVRLFAMAECDPPACHACGKKIKVGQIFKLVPHHRKYGYPSDSSSPDWQDEMCCSRCGEPELVKRDKRDMRRDRAGTHLIGGSPVSQPHSGFSRPSKMVPK